MTKSRMIRNRLPADWYETNVDRTTDPDGCHPWTGGCFQSGYGRIRVSGKTYRAHRWGWMHYIGPIPDGLIIRHTCDNPPCQNRTHWLLGTNKQNTADMDERGRRNASCGSDNHLSVLTEAQVLAIRAAYVKAPYVRGGTTQKMLADRYGVSRSLISMIVHRKVWAHI